MSEKWFVIGSNSFSGSTMIQALLEQGHDVIGISRSSENAKALLPYAWLNSECHKTYKFHQLDLNHDTDAILRLIKAQKADFIVNFAAQSMVAESWQNPEHWYQTNVVANVRLHEGLRKFDFIKKYIHVTTPEVYGSCSGNVTESAPFNPTTPYAASRAACDLHLMTFFKQYQFPVCFTRAANVYGPGQPLYRIIPRCLFYFRTGQRLQLHGGGRSVRSFIHMRDVADGTMRVARQSPLGECYHFSTDVYLSIREVVEKICDRMKISFKDAVEVVDERPGKDAAYLLDSAKAKKNLGWTPQIDLDQGIDECLRWMDLHVEELKKLPSHYIHKP